VAILLFSLFLWFLLPGQVRTDYHPDQGTAGYLLISSQTLNVIHLSFGQIPFIARIRDKPVLSALSGNTPNRCDNGSPPLVLQPTNFQFVSRHKLDLKLEQLKVSRGLPIKIKSIMILSLSPGH